MIHLPDQHTPILCQGITSSMGATHTEMAIAYGSNIVAGTSRDKGISQFLNVPVFQTVKDAVNKTKPLVSIIFSTPARAFEETEAAIKARIPLIICTAEHVPAHDVLRMKALAEKYHVHLIGPSSLGLVRTGECLAGSIPAHLFPNGNIGIVGRSSSLIYEAVQQLSEKGLGVSSCVSLGAGELLVTSFVPVYDALLGDPKTKIILIIGQLHGLMEFELADFYKKSRRKKPTIVYMAGEALLKSNKIPILGTHLLNPAQIIFEKQQALNKVGIQIVQSSVDIGRVCAQLESAQM